MLVVVADGPLRIPAPAKARLTMVEPHLTALVAMPYVTRWRETDQALEEAVAALRYPNQIPKWLQPWTEALGQVMAALVDSPPEVPGAPAGDVTNRPAMSPTGRQTASETRHQNPEPPWEAAQPKLSGPGRAGRQCLDDRRPGHGQCRLDHRRDLRALIPHTPMGG